MIGNGKPFMGILTDWIWQGSRIIGTDEDGSVVWTDRVVQHDEATGIIETLTEVYKLHTPRV